LLQITQNQIQTIDWFCCEKNSAVPGEKRFWAAQRAKRQTRNLNQGKLAKRNISGTAFTG